MIIIINLIFLYLCAGIIYRSYLYQTRKEFNNHKFNYFNILTLLLGIIIWPLILSYYLIKNHMLSKKLIWVVAHQSPRHRIIALYKTPNNAYAHESPKDQVKHSTVIYPCPMKILKNQSGYRSDLKIKE
jgi:hypothetical protein